MKKTILILALLLPVAAGAAKPTHPDRWVPGERFVALGAFWATLCETLGGEYGYTQTPEGPTGWECKGIDWSSILGS